MNKTLALIMTLVCMLSGCDDQNRSVEGVLQHFPSDVRSAEAWHGHNFMVGDTPIIPTDAVGEGVLLPLVGKDVMAEGIWFEGKEWQPRTEDEQLSQMPMEATEGRVVRGDGLKLTTIRSK